jgi:mRNA interferase MazF
MNTQRGDVVLIDYPYGAGGSTKVRPVLVIQNYRDNQRLLNTIVAQITSVTRRALEPTQVLIELTTPEGQQSGLRQDSVINFVNLFTLDQGRILRKLGRLPDSLMQEVDICLKIALQLSSARGNNEY